MNIQLIKKLSSAATMGSLIFGLATPMALADVDVNSTWNGAGSDTNINSYVSSNTGVVQGNTANIDTQIHSYASSGNNQASYNGGAEVAIITGDATSKVSVENYANLNKALIESGAGQDLNVTSAWNGAYSDTNVNAAMKQEASVYQNNVADINNHLEQHAKSGYNEANGNTGGDVFIGTGNALTEAYVKTAVNANIAKVVAPDDQESHSVTSQGNGAYSDTNVNLYSKYNVGFMQNNDADVNNTLHNYASSGYNLAKHNTGGEVGIHTGNASSYSKVKTLANLNYAYASPMMSHLSALVSGNGAWADTNVNHTFKDNVSAYQNNGLGGSVYIHEDPETGRNEVAWNNVWMYDPFIYTGDASSHYEVKTLANANVFSTDSAHAGMEIDFDFDMGALWGLIH